MDDLMNELVKRFQAKGIEVRVTNLGEEPKCKCTCEAEPKDEFAEAKKEAAHIAEMNRILYEAHIEAGFTKNEALALTRTTITCN